MGSVVRLFWGWQRPKTEGSRSNLHVAELASLISGMDFLFAAAYVQPWLQRMIGFSKYRQESVPTAIVITSARKDGPKAFQLVSGQSCPGNYQRHRPLIPA